MGTYKTNEFRKGLKVQIDGEPYLMVEMNFRKPGKGNALYQCKLRNLVRGTMLQKTYKGGDTLESADVEEVEVKAAVRLREDDRPDQIDCDAKCPGRGRLPVLPQAAAGQPLREAKNQVACASPPANDDQ